MFRIADLKVIAPTLEFMYGMAYEDKDGNDIDLNFSDDAEVEEAEFREVSKIVFDGYTDKGIPKVVFYLKYEPEFLHIGNELLQGIVLKEFLDTLYSSDENDISIRCDRALDKPGYVKTFELYPDPQRIKPPVVRIQTGDALVQLHPDIIKKYGKNEEGNI